VPQDVVIVLREAMGFVADILQQSQRRGVAAELDRLRYARAENLFFLFRKRNERRRRDTERS
jgi:hypothetical protein